MKKSCQKGVANFLGIIGLAILILVIPLTVKLVEQRQETRRFAQGPYPTVTPQCVPNCSGKSCGSPDGCGGACNAGCTTPTSPPALPGDWESWRCPGPHCDRCGYAGWWGGGCEDFCSAHPNDGSCRQKGINGPLTACGGFENQCSAGSGPVRDCNGDNKIVIRSCGNDGCYHDTATSEDCVPLVQVPAPTTQEQQQLQQAIQTEAEKRCQEQFGLSQTSLAWQNCLDEQKTEIVKELTVEETRFNSQTAIAESICQRQYADRNERMWENCLNRFVAVINDGFNIDPVTGHKYLPPEAVQASNCHGVTVFSNDPVNYYDCQTGDKVTIDARTRNLCELKAGLVDYDYCRSQETQARTRCQADIHRGEKEGDRCLGVQREILHTEMENEETRKEVEMAKRDEYCSRSGGFGLDLDDCLSSTAKQIARGYSIELSQDPATGEYTDTLYLEPVKARKLTECAAGSPVAQDDFGNWYSCFGGTELTEAEAAQKLGVTELPSATANQQLTDSIVKPGGQFYANFVKAVADKDKGATTFWVKDEQGNDVPVTIQIGFGQAGADGYLIAMGGHILTEGKISDVQGDFDQAQKKADEIKTTGFDPYVLSLINEGALQRIGLASGETIPSGHKPFDPNDPELQKKYGPRSQAAILCEVSYQGSYKGFAGNACSPKQLYLKDVYGGLSGAGVSVATNIDSAKRAYQDTSALCGVLADKWNENCQEIFVAKFGGDLVSNQNAVKHAVVMIGTSGLPLIPAILSPLHVSPAAPVTFTLDALSLLGSTIAFSAKEEDQRYAPRILLEDKFGKGITDVNGIGNYSAYDLAQKAKLDIPALGDKSILDNRYLIYTMVVTGFNLSGIPGPTPKPVAQITDPGEREDFLNKINGSLPSNAKFKDWGELVQFSMLREGLLDYQNKALQTGSGMVFQEKEAEYRQVLVTNTVFGLAAVGGMSVVGKGIGKAVDMVVVNRAAQTLKREVAVSRWTSLLAGAGRNEEGAVARALGQDAAAKIILTDGRSVAAQTVKDNFQQYSTKIAGIVFGEDRQLAVQAVNEAAKGAGLLERLSPGRLAQKVDKVALVEGKVALTPEAAAARLAKAPAPAAPAQPRPPTQPAAPAAEAPKVIPPAKYGIRDRLPIIGGEPAKIEVEVVDDLISGRVTVPQDQLDHAVRGLLEQKGYRPGSLAEGVKNVRNSLKIAQEKAVAEAQQAAELAAAPIVPAAPVAPAPAGVPQAVVDTINNLPAPLQRPARGLVIDLPEAIGGVTQRFNEGPGQRIAQGLSDATNRARNIFKRGGEPTVSGLTVDENGAILVGQKEAPPTTNELESGLKNFFGGTTDGSPGYSIVDYTPPANLSLESSLQKAGVKTEMLESARLSNQYIFSETVSLGERKIPYLSAKIYIQPGSQETLDEFILVMNRDVAPKLRAKGIGFRIKNALEEIVTYIEYDASTISKGDIDEALNLVKKAAEGSNPRTPFIPWRGPAEDPAGFVIKGGAIERFSPGPYGHTSNDTVTGFIAHDLSTNIPDEFLIVNGKRMLGLNPEQILELLESSPSFRRGTLERFGKLTQLTFRDLKDLTKRGTIPIAVDMSDEQSLKLAAELAQKLQRQGYKTEFIDAANMVFGKEETYIADWVFENGKYTVSQGIDQQKVLQALAQGMGLKVETVPVAQRSVVDNFKRIGLGTQSFIEKVSDDYAKWADNFNANTAPKIDKAITDATDRVRNVFKRVEVQPPTGGAPAAAQAGLLQRATAPIKNLSDRYAQWADNFNATTGPRVDKAVSDALDNTQNTLSGLRAAVKSSTRKAPSTEPRIVASYDQSTIRNWATLRNNIEEGAEITIVVQDTTGKISQVVIKAESRDQIVSGINALVWEVKPQRVLLEVSNPSGFSFSLKLNSAYKWYQLTENAKPFRVGLGNAIGISPGNILGDALAGAITTRFICVVTPISRTGVCEPISKVIDVPFLGTVGLISPVEDAIFIKTLIFENCEMGQTKILPSRTGYVACTDKGRWEGECLPKNVTFDSRTGIPIICGDDYKYHPMPADQISAETYTTFAEAEKYRLELNKKYNVNIVASVGYWKTDELRLLDKIFPELPRYFYNDKTINAYINGFALWGDVPGGIPWYLRLTWSNGVDSTNFGARELFLEVLVHELLHTVDESGGVFLNFSNTSEFEGLINQYHLRFIDKADAEGKVKTALIMTKNGEDIELDSHYNCSRANFEEFFACAGTLYIFEPEKLKTDFPDLYEFYKKKVFQQKEYLGRNLASEIINAVFSQAKSQEPILPPKTLTPSVTPTKTPTVPPAGTITPTPQSPTATTVPPPDRVGNNVACFLINSCPNTNGVPLGFAVAQDNIDKFNKLKLYKNMPDGEYEYTVFEGNIMPGSATVDVKVIVTNGRYAIWIRAHAEPGQVQQNYTIYASGSVGDLSTVGSLGPTQLPGLSPGTGTPTTSASVTITQENVDRLKTFPRPPGDNGRGIHFGGLCDEEKNCSGFYNDLRIAKEMGVKWGVLYSENQNVAIKSAERLWKENIMPIIRFKVKTDNVGGNLQSWVRITTEKLKAQNIPVYIQIYNEPTADIEWTSGKAPTAPGAAAKRFAQNWRTIANIIYEAGGYPGFQVTGQDELDALLTEIPVESNRDFWEKTWFAWHGYGDNTTTGEKLPPHYMPSNERDDGVLNFLRWAEVFEDKFGFVPPIIGTENGWIVKPPEGQSEPTAEEIQKHAEYHKVVYDSFRTGVLPNGEPLPDYLFTFSPFTLSPIQGYQGFSWLSGLYGNLDGTLRAIESIPDFQRKFSWDVTTTKPPTVTPTRTQTPTVSGNEYQPFDVKIKLPSSSYKPATDRDANAPKVRGYSLVPNAPLALIDYKSGSQFDPYAPKLNTLLKNHSNYTFSNLYRIPDPVNPNAEKLYPGNLLGIEVKSGEVVQLPYAGQYMDGTFRNLKNPHGMGQDYRALVIYVCPDGSCMTINYVPDDFVRSGYALHLEGLKADPTLLALYNQLNAAGRSQLPALKDGQAIGVTSGTELKVSIRDNGTFIDPRSKDWWVGATTNAPTIKVPTPTTSSPRGYLEIPQSLWQQVLTAVSGSIISAISVISLLFGGR